MNIYVPNAELNLGINRDKMPQIVMKDVKDFLVYILEFNIASESFTQPISKLIPTQSEFNEDKIKKLINYPAEFLSRPIIVSKDNYILDGHHRVIALYNKNPNSAIQTYRVNASIQELLKYAHMYEKSFVKSVNESARFKFNEFLINEKL